MDDHLPDEALLLAAHHAHRLSSRQRRHLAKCVQCRHEQKKLSHLLDGQAEPAMDAPEFSKVAPKMTRPTVSASWRKRAVAGAAVLSLLAFWPKLLWPSAPLGPVALGTLLDSRSIALKATTSHVHGRITVTANRRAGWMLLSYAHVTRLPSHHVYEVWWIQRKEHIRAGVFRVLGHRATVWLHTLKPVAQAEAIGITTEPSPGSSHPTGPKTFFGIL